MPARDLAVTEFATHASSSQRLLPRPINLKASARTATAVIITTAVIRLQATRFVQRTNQVTMDIVECFEAKCDMLYSTFLSESDQPDSTRVSLGPRSGTRTVGVFRRTTLIDR